MTCTCTICRSRYAPASQRNPDGGCKQAFDNPQMDYMDKTVFFRNRVIGINTSGAAKGKQVGFSLLFCDFQ